MTSTTNFGEVPDIEWPGTLTEPPPAMSVADMAGPEPTPTAAPVAPPAAPQPVVAPTNADVPVLFPAPDVLTLKSGTVVALNKINTNELFALAGIVISVLDLQQLKDLAASQDDEDDEDDEDADMRLVMSLLAGVGERFDRIGPKLCAFVRMLVAPADRIHTGGKLHKQDEARNKELVKALNAELKNPDPIDTIAIIRAVLQREAGDLRALGKDLLGMVRMLSGLGLTRNRPKSQG